MSTTIVELDYYKKKISLALIQDELDSVLQQINNAIAQPSIGEHSIVTLKKYRQKIYEKRRAFRLIAAEKRQNKVSDPSRDASGDQISRSRDLEIKQENKTQILTDGCARSEEIKDFIPVPPRSEMAPKQKQPNGSGDENSILSFGSGILFPVTILYIMLLAGATYFCWLNSKQLFADHGVANADINTFWFIVVGCLFAMFYALEHGAKRYVYGMLCALMVIFEAWFLVTGTMSVEQEANEKRVAERILRRVGGSNEIKYLNGALENAQWGLGSIMEKYENPSLKTYKNDWYKNKFVVPAKKEVQALELKILEIKASITKEESIPKAFSNVSALFKVGMRLFFAIACFVLVHKVTRFFNDGIGQV